MASYFGLRNTKPKFDFSDIRPKGQRLITAGGKAPGPEPLKKCLFEIEQILERKQDGEKLSTLEVHDIICHIADAVLAGGIRRAALISLFSADDEQMLTCKYGNWWELNPQRGRANNSAVLVRHRITEDFFKKLWKKVELSGSGEPGIYFTNNPDWGTNPCAEIALRPYQFCNLCEINADQITNESDFEKAVEVTVFFGTLQAGFTDFHYLRPIWQKTTEKEALLGIGITGIASGKLEKYNLTSFANLAKRINTNYAEILGINPATRITTVKPSGTTSCVLGTSSGIHSWHSNFYIRRMQLTKQDPVYQYLAKEHPYTVKDHLLIPNSVVVEIPIKAPKDAITRHDETALKLLERIEKYNRDWVRAGHSSGDNTNNVSATISVKENEWDEVGNWMWENRNNFNGLSVLPFDGGIYQQAPFEDITEEVYNQIYSQFGDIDLTKVIEEEDNTQLTQEVACAGGNCEVQI